MFQKKGVASTHMDGQDVADQSARLDSVETVVGPSVHVEGDFSSEGDIVVKGRVSGTVKTSQILRVESGAGITANVRAAEAFVSGEITGNVRISGHLDLSQTARILGDITCATLSMEAGALIYGKVSMKALAEVVNGAKKKTKRKKSRKVESSEEVLAEEGNTL